MKKTAGRLAAAVGATVVAAGVAVLTPGTADALAGGTHCGTWRLTTYSKGVQLGTAYAAHSSWGGIVTDNGYSGFQTSSGFTLTGGGGSYNFYVSVPSVFAHSGTWYGPGGASGTYSASWENYSGC